MVYFPLWIVALFRGAPERNILDGLRYCFFVTGFEAQCVLSLTAFYTSGAGRNLRGIFSDSFGYGTHNSLQPHIRRHVFFSNVCRIFAGLYRLYPKCWNIIFLSMGYVYISKILSCFLPIRVSFCGL